MSSFIFVPVNDLHLLGHSDIYLANAVPYNLGM